MLSTKAANFNNQSQINTSDWWALHPAYMWRLHTHFHRLANLLSPVFYVVFIQIKFICYIKQSNNRSVLWTPTWLLSGWTRCKLDYLRTCPQLPFYQPQLLLCIASYVSSTLLHTFYSLGWINRVRVSEGHANALVYKIHCQCPLRSFVYPIA